MSFPTKDAEKQHSITTKTSTTETDACTNQKNVQQLCTITRMCAHDIDNTINSLKESAVQFVEQKKIMRSNVMEKSTELEQMMPTTSNSSVSDIMMLQTFTIDVSAAANEVKTVLPPTPPATPNLQNVARKRWKILAKVLRKNDNSAAACGSFSSEECEEEQAASVRRFKTFDLLRQDSFDEHSTLNCLGKPENWYKYRVQLEAEHAQYTVNIHHMERQLTANDLMGFNNTGNICIWPSEEALTAYVLSNLPAYKGKWILELGGGFTCLSGLMLSKYAQPYAVHLTDGNLISVDNVRKTVCLNNLCCYTKCSVLKWEDVLCRSPAEAAKFDTILSADCLFFDEARSALVDTIWYYLAPVNGVALIMAPQRGKTMTLFIEQCTARGFLVQILHRYNDAIWQRHLELKNNSQLYDENLHYPVLLRLSKPQQLVNI